MPTEILLEVLSDAVNSKNHIANFSKNYDGVYVTINFYRTQSFIISWLYIKIGPYSDSAFGASYNPQTQDLRNSLLWAFCYLFIEFVIKFRRYHLERSSNEVLIEIVDRCYDWHYEFWFIILMPRLAFTTHKIRK